MKTLFVTGTDTAVGKTWISCLLIRHLIATGHRTGAYKPVCSGAECSPEGVLTWHDPGALSDACGGRFPIDWICPQRYAAPVAPPVAARLEGRCVDANLRMAGLQRGQPVAETVVVEGAGGLLCPLSDDLTVADLAMSIGSRLVVVAANRLGVVNQTLLTLEVARSRDLPVLAVVLNDLRPAMDLPSPDAKETNCPADASRPDQMTDPSRSTNATLLSHWISEIPLFHCEFRGERLTPVNAAANAAVDWFRQIR